MEGEGPFRKGNAKEGRKAKPTQKASPISQTCPIRVVCKINHTAASPASLETPRFSNTDRSHAVIQLLGRNFSPIHDRSAAAASSSFHCSSFFFSSFPIFALRLAVIVHSVTFHLDALSKLDSRRNHAIESEDHVWSPSIFEWRLI